MAPLRAVAVSLLAATASADYLYTTYLSQPATATSPTCTGASVTVLGGYSEGGACTNLAGNLSQRIACLSPTQYTALIFQQPNCMGVAEKAQWTNTIGACSAAEIQTAKIQLCMSSSGAVPVPVPPFTPGAVTQTIYSGPDCSPAQLVGVQSFPANTCSPNYPIGGSALQYTCNATGVTVTQFNGASSTSCATGPAVQAPYTVPYGACVQSGAGGGSLYYTMSCGMTRPSIGGGSGALNGADIAAITVGCIVGAVAVGVLCVWGSCAAGRAVAEARAAQGSVAGFKPDPKFKPKREAFARAAAGANAGPVAGGTGIVVATAV